VVLACTELPLALNEENCRIGVLDTTRLLAERALAFSQARADTEASPEFELRGE
jgi:aspartate/glutamate racemase